MTAGAAAGVAAAGVAGGQGAAGPGPFSARTVIFVVLTGFAAFFGLLYALGQGGAFQPSNNGQAHGASYSLVGYKALAQMIAKSGTEVRYARSPAGQDDPGLLVVTPGYSADPAELAKLVAKRKYTGPTLIIMSKWLTQDKKGLKPGWTSVIGPGMGDARDLSLLVPGAELAIVQDGASKPRLVSPFAERLPAPRHLTSISGGRLVPVVRDATSNGIIVTLLDNGGYYPEFLGDDTPKPADAGDYDIYPVVIVADPDLFDNMGLADKATARHALALIDTMHYDDSPATFDLVMAGLGSSDNLLSLAFRPPFLSATLCLIAAALAAIWMAFNRFGPPAHAARALDYGKTALVRGSAGFVARVKREYLLAAPYAALVRAQAAAAAGIPATLSAEDTEQQLDRIGSYRGHSFSALADHLRAATSPADIAARAAALYEWKKEMTR